jgi:hypothetical protein
VQAMAQAVVIRRWILDGENCSGSGRSKTAQFYAVIEERLLDGGKFYEDR